MDRREFIVRELLVPIIAGGVSGGAVAVLSKRLEQRHSMSISVIPLDDAVRPAQGPVLEPFEVPPKTPAPGSGTRYTYATVFANDGDFSEENVQIALGFQGPPTASSQLT